MEFNGEIVFGIADANPIKVDFGGDILPTKRSLRNQNEYKGLYTLHHISLSID